MKDKFKGNLLIALPAAVITLVLVIIISASKEVTPVVGEYSLIQIIPYLLVLVGGVLGINVFIVLLIGIVSGAGIMLITNAVNYIEMFKCVGESVTGMFETSMVAILVAALCALIREYGGFDALLSFIRRVFKGNKGGQLGMGLLVGAMDIATANNTVAIVMANPIAKEMREEYHISPARSACILDTFSCVFQGIIPYGAQILYAVGAASTLGIVLSPFQIMQYLFYPYLLLVCCVVAILLTKKKK